MKTKKKKKRLMKRPGARKIRFILALALIRIMRIIPRSWALSTGKNLGLLYYRIGNKYRNRALSNLTMAFGNEKSEAEIRRIAQGVFAHFGETAADAIRIPLYAGEKIGAVVRPKNFHYAEKALSGGRGVIFLTAHFGNWELLGAWLAAKGYPIRVVGTPAGDPGFDRLIVETRNQAGYYNIARGKSPREIIRAIRDGYSLGFLIDQDTDVKGVFVDFFGKKAHTATGPVVLASRYQIPVIPAFARMKEDRTYEAEFFPPISLADTGNPEKDILTNTQRCSDIYETVIRRHPEQWAWMHKRWKKQPEG